MIKEKNFINQFAQVFSALGQVLGVLGIVASLGLFFIGMLCFLGKAQVSKKVSATHPANRTVGASLMILSGAMIAERGAAYLMAQPFAQNDLSLVLYCVFGIFLIAVFLASIYFSLKAFREIHKLADESQ